MVREKYIEERWKRWMVFGVHDDGFVDVAEGGGSDVVCHVTQEQAEKLIAERDIVIDLIVRLFQCVPKEVADVELGYR